MGVRHILYSYAVGKAAGQLYYVVVMAQLMLMRPWLAKRKSRKWLYLVTPAYLLLLYGYNLYTRKMPMLYETVFPAWFGFYIFGMDCRAGVWDAVIRKAKKWWIAAALGAETIESVVLLKCGCAFGFAESQIRFGSFLYAGVIALVLMKYKDIHIRDGWIKKWMVSVGDDSSAIFYVHTLILMVVQMLVSPMLAAEAWIPDCMLYFILTLVGSGLVIWVTRLFAKAVKAEKALRFIGFQ